MLHCVQHELTSARTCTEAGVLAEQTSISWNGRRLRLRPEPMLLGFAGGGGRRMVWIAVDMAGCSALHSGASCRVGVGLCVSGGREVGG